MKKDERDALARGTTSIISALGSGLASSYQQNDLATLISIAGAVAPDIAPHLVELGRQRLVRLCPGFFAGVVEGAGASVNDAVDSPQDAEALFEAYRRMVNVQEPFAAHALGKMAGIYIRNDWRVDQFFRAAGRVIEELGAAEYDALRELVNAAGTDGQASYTDAIDISINPPNNNLEGAGAQVFYRKGESWYGLKVAGANIRKSDALARAIFVLRTHGLSKDVKGMSTWGGTTTPADSLHLDLGLVAARLRDILAKRED